MAKAAIRRLKFRRKLAAWLPGLGHQPIKQDRRLPKFRHLRHARALAKMRAMIEKKRGAK